MSSRFRLCTRIGMPELPDRWGAWDTVEMVCVKSWDKRRPATKWIKWMNRNDVGGAQHRFVLGDWSVLEGPPVEPIGKLESILGLDRKV